MWAWVIQLGADRGGFYSYDWLENIFGLQIHSATRIVPAWEQRAVGELVQADRRGRGGWYVMNVKPERALILQMSNPKTGRPSRRDEPPHIEFTWSFVLERRADGRTRLLVRERVAFGTKAARLVFSPVGFVSFVMTQKMMRGIKARAEARDARNTHRLPASKGTA